MTPRPAKDKTGSIIELWNRKVLDSEVGKHHLIEILYIAMDDAGARQHVRPRIRHDAGSRTCNLRIWWSVGSSRKRNVRSSKALLHRGMRQLSPSSFLSSIDTTFPSGPRRGFPKRGYSTHECEGSDLAEDAMFQHPSFMTWAWKLFFTGLRFVDTSYVWTNSELNNVEICVNTVKKQKIIPRTLGSRIDWRGRDHSWWWNKAKKKKVSRRV